MGLCYKLPVYGNIIETKGPPIHCETRSDFVCESTVALAKMIHDAIVYEVFPLQTRGDMDIYIGSVPKTATKTEFRWGATAAK